MTPVGPEFSSQLIMLKKSFHKVIICRHELVHRHRRLIHLIGLQAFGNMRIFLVFVNVPNESVH